MKAKAEIKRLCKHPELFPSKEVNDAFHHDMKSLLGEVLNYNGPEAKALRSEERRELREKVMQQSGNPGYTKQDPRRKPWQQYLHNRAPGAGLDQSVMADGCSNQVIPHAGLRILENWTLNYLRAYQHLKKVSFFSE